MNAPKILLSALFFAVALSLVFVVPNMFAHSTEWKNTHIQFKLGKQVRNEFSGEKTNATVAISNGDGLLPGEHCVIPNHSGTTIKILGQAQAPDYRYLVQDETMYQNHINCGSAQVLVSPEDFQRLQLAANTSITLAQAQKIREDRATKKQDRMREEVESIKMVGK